MDQRSANSINKVIGIAFIIFGICMLMIGIPLLFESNKDSVLSFITTMCLFSGSLLIVGGYQNIKKGKEKDKALNEYQQSINEQLSNSNKKSEIVVEKKSEEQITNNSEQIKDEKYVPDIIANWQYTIPEWKKMTKEERMRRTKEGVWLSLLIGVGGTALLLFMRGADFWTAFLISFFVGIFISILKILISNNEMKSTGNNNIIFTTNALIINGTFKTINDLDIKLEYLKLVKNEFGDFIEFSIQWGTRNGVTNDQFRILIPEKYKNEAKNIFDYFDKKGVKTEYN